MSDRLYEIYVDILIGEEARLTSKHTVCGEDEEKAKNQAIAQARTYLSTCIQNNPRVRYDTSVYTDEHV